MSDARPLDGLDLNLLFTLRALTDTGSVTLAAQRLSTTQPTVSRALAQLRDCFDDPILVRSGRAMALTPLAQSLREPLARALNALDRLRGVATFEPAGAQRQFRLILPDVFGVGAVPTLLARLADAPSVSMTVHGVEGEGLRALLYDEVDVVVADRRFEHPELCVRTVRPAVGWKVVLGRHHPDCARRLTRPRWLASKHLQLIPGGRPFVEGAVDRRLRERGERRIVAAHVSYLAAIAPVLQQTALVTSLPAPAADWVAAAGSLVVQPHPLDRELPRVSAQITWHASHQRDEGHRWFRNEVARAIEAWMR